MSDTTLGARGVPRMSDRTFLAVFSGSALEPYLDRSRCAVEEPSGLDGEWALRLYVGLTRTAGRTATADYRLLVGRAVGDHECWLSLYDLGNDGRRVLDARFTPAPALSTPSVIDVLFAAVDRAAARIILASGAQG